MKPAFISSLLIFSFAFMTDSFKSQQQKFPRVKTAYEEKEKAMKELFSAKGIELSAAGIFIRAFKQEAQLEIWAKNKQEKYELIKTYSICSSSGELGPKRKQGDGQVPEGFYEIERFNPSSNFYLSLGVSYPNASDKILGEKKNLGGDIFIHGNCVTIGCMPITDDKIKEVYVMAVEAKSNGGKIPVHLFPFRMSEENMKLYGEKYPQHLAFWKNIQKGYAYFESAKTLPSVKVLNNGEYSFY
ncbi:MAG: L,D-transpeptidase family protein [Bacteroidetes bacterium]|nr:L,D-transpeptidase family protein [Bacteroidota bacterium]